MHTALALAIGHPVPTIIRRALELAHRPCHRPSGPDETSSRAVDVHPTGSRSILMHAQCGRVASSAAELAAHACAFRQYPCAACGAIFLSNKALGSHRHRGCHGRSQAQGTTASSSTRGRLAAASQPAAPAAAPAMASAQGLPSVRDDPQRDAMTWSACDEWAEPRPRLLNPSMVRGRPDGCHLVRVPVRTSRVGAQYQAILPGLHVSSLLPPPAPAPRCCCGEMAVWDRERWWCARRSVATRCDGQHAPPPPGASTDPECAHRASLLPGCDYEAEPPPMEQPETPLCMCGQPSVWARAHWWCARGIREGCGHMQVGTDRAGSYAAASPPPPPNPMDALAITPASGAHRPCDHTSASLLADAPPPPSDTCPTNPIVPIPSYRSHRANPIAAIPSYRSRRANPIAPIPLSIVSGGRRRHRPRASRAS